MTSSSVKFPLGLRPFYPYMSDSYNDQDTSDIALCFGDNRVHLHKIILKAASGLWNQAFRSKLPISTNNEYHIQGHSDLVVHTMLQYIYGKPLDARPPEVPENGRLDYLFDVFGIANEYQIPSLGAAVTERVIQLMKMYPIEKKPNTFFIVYSDAEVAEGKKMFRAIMSKTADFYINNNVADKSLMDGVLDACFTLVKNIKWLEENIDLVPLIGKHDPFSGRLLQLYLPMVQFRD